LEPVERAFVFAGLARDGQLNGMKRVNVPAVSAYTDTLKFSFPFAGPNWEADDKRMLM
jgi:hypothetical protein